MNNIFFIIVIAVYIYILYYLIAGRRKKQQKQQAAMLETLHPGTGVETISGVYCTVLEVLDREVLVDISADPSRVIRAKILKAGIKGVRA